MPTLAAVDFGFGYTKAVAQVGDELRKVVLPSTIRAMPRGADIAGAFGNTVRDGHRISVTRSGGKPETHLVGAIGGQRTWDDLAASRTGYVASVIAALRLMGVQGAVHLAIGVPLGWWGNQAQRNALAALFDGLKVEASLNGETPVQIAVESIGIYAQGAGAFLAELSVDSSVASRPAALVDVGFRTSDLIYLHRVDGALAPDMEASGSFDAGVGRIMDRTREIIAERAGVTPTEAKIEEALEEYEGKLPVAGIDVDVRAIIQEQAKVLAGEIGEEIRRRWAEHLPFLGVVLLSGGGGQTLHPYLRPLHPSVRLTRDPLFANANGFLRMLKTSLERQKGAVPLR